MTPHSILIIDDDEQLRSLFRRVLEREVGLLDAPALHGAPRMMKKPITIAALLKAVAQELMD